MPQNPWAQMTIDDARAYDHRKEHGPYRKEIATKRAILRRLIDAHLPKAPSPILDLGGGTGIWTIPLAQMGHHIYLADISKGLLALAKEKLHRLGLTHRVTIIETDACNLSMLSDNTFPLTLALGDPLSYSTDPVQALREIRRVTLPGGILIGDVENRYGGIDHHRAETWPDLLHILQQGTTPPTADGYTIHMFTPSDLQTTAQTAGWEIVNIYPSDILSSLLTKEHLDHLTPDPHEWIELEETLRQDPHLLGIGKELQFILRNP